MPQHVPNWERMGAIVHTGEASLEVQARSTRRVLVVVAMVVAALVSGIGLAPEARPASRWAAAPVATIHPGVMTFTPVGQCTANFVFFQGVEVFIGQAAHCAGTGAPTDTDGCAAGSLPLGTPVEIEGASRPGTMVYSSWLAMEAAGEQDPATCAYNDFALVRIDPADRAKVNPTLPHWGGPTGISRTTIPAFANVYTIGNSGLRQGLRLLQPKVGVAFGTEGGGWSHPTYNLLPGIPGDSGGPVLDAAGRATGLLVTVELAPVVGRNGVTDMSKALAYARTHGMPGLLLALGTVPFNPAQLPLG
jgi:hypothetical protein